MRKTVRAGDRVLDTLTVYSNKLAAIADTPRARGTDTRRVCRRCAADAGDCSAPLTKADRLAPARAGVWLSTALTWTLHTARWSSRLFCMLLGVLHAHEFLTSRIFFTPRILSFNISIRSFGLMCAADPQERDSVSMQARHAWLSLPVHTPSSAQWEANSMWKCPAPRHSRRLQVPYSLLYRLASRRTARRRDFDVSPLTLLLS